MKQYKEIHHTRGNNEDGSFAWTNPVEKRIVVLEDNHAEDLKSQFETTGVKLEPVEENELLLEYTDSEEHPNVSFDETPPSTGHQIQVGSETIDAIPASQKDGAESPVLTDLIPDSQKEISNQ